MICNLKCLIHKFIVIVGMASPPPGFKHEVIALPPGALPSKDGDIALDVGMYDYIADGS